MSTLGDACTMVFEPTRMCVSCPELPFIQAVPARTVVDPRLGWNSSARSAVELDGDCYVSFSAPQVVGLVIGFATQYQPTDPVSIRHGFYMLQRSGRDVYHIIERGIVQTVSADRDVDIDRYRVERVGEQVQYKVNGTVVHSSTVPSRGQIMVVACMYAASDGVY
jgi:hypothetical protein